MGPRFKSDCFDECDDCGYVAFCRHYFALDNGEEYGWRTCPKCWAAYTGEVFWVDGTGVWIDTGERVKINYAEDDDGNERDEPEYPEVSIERRIYRS